MKLTLDIKNEEDWLFLRELLKKLQIEVSEFPTITQNQAEAINALTRISQRGLLAKEIQDPILWQKEIQKDRNLPFSSQD